jgi:hypothetical protein
MTGMLLAGAFALSPQTNEVERLKSDLIGQTMGGRHECWKFQSADQIKELTVKGKTGDAQKQIYTVALQLEAMPACGRYAAEARVEYTKTDTGWKVKQVGLLSLKKINRPSGATEK